MRCPYWHRTSHATVRCEFLGAVHADEDADNYRARIEAHSGSAQAARAAVGRSLLYDEIKTCGINNDDEG